MTVTQIALCAESWHLTQPNKWHKIDAIAQMTVQREAKATTHRKSYADKEAVNMNAEVAAMSWLKFISSSSSVMTIGGPYDIP